VRTGITPAEALRIVLEHAPVLGSEMLGVAESAGRVLAEPILASRELPPADNSAMDGYAVRAADLVGACAERPVSLRLAFEIPAGATPERTLGPGEAARILTGAPLPPGADAVVRQEDAAPLPDDRVEVRVAAAQGDHVRRAGEDMRVGEPVLDAGARIGPGQLGVLTSLGRSFVAVRQRPRVALVSGGDELVEPDGDVAGGRIVSSNSYSLAAQCREIGVESLSLGIARDTPDDIERRLRSGLSAHVLVSSAGVSVGDRDYVRGVLEKLGCRLLFWGVAMRPGFPLTFGRFGEEGDDRGPLVFGLPGNPVSAMVTFEQFVRPALLRMMGHSALHRPTLQAKLAETLHKAPGRMHFVRVTLSRRGDEVVAHSTGNQGSGLLRSMAEAQGLLLFPGEASELRAGDTATVQLLDETFLAADTPGF
jgi:molybdopterin molybdotransferase